MKSMKVACYPQVSLRLLKHCVIGFFGGRPPCPRWAAPGVIQGCAWAGWTAAHQPAVWLRKKGSGLSTSSNLRPSICQNRVPAARTKLRS
jgi:hypothetical protein